MRVLLAVAMITVGIGCSKPSQDHPTEPNPTATKTPEPKAEQPGAKGATAPPEGEIANKAFDELQKALGKRLKGAMAEGGPAAAIDVCSKEANALTAEVAKRHKIALGRTSHRLRNPENAPRPWVATWLDESKGKKAVELSPYEAALDGAFGYIKPIPMGGLCVTCHGDPAGLPEEVKGALAERYPKDQATGFAVGDLRGVFWAEVPRVR